MKAFWDVFTLWFIFGLGTAVAAAGIACQDRKRLQEGIERDGIILTWIFVTAATLIYAIFWPYGLWHDYVKPKPPKVRTFILPFLLLVLMSVNASSNAVVAANAAVDANASHEQGNTKAAPLRSDRYILVAANTYENILLVWDIKNHELLEVDYDARMVGKGLLDRNQTREGREIIQDLLGN